jgi:hypothetical protein
MEARSGVGPISVPYISCSPSLSPACLLFSGFDRMIRCYAQTTCYSTTCCSLQLGSRTACPVLVLPHARRAAARCIMASAKHIDSEAQLAGAATASTAAATPPLTDASELIGAHACTP